MAKLVKAALSKGVLFFSVRIRAGVPRLYDTYSMKIKTVTIVGGGSSGWMTAAALAKQLPQLEITLVESPNIPIIGVGESTLAAFNIFLDCLDLKDEEWMPHCNATYKTSIKFVDFRENPQEERHTFHYPFGIFDVTDKPRGLMDWFLYKIRHPELDNNNFAEFFHDAILMSDTNKMTKNSPEKRLHPLHHSNLPEQPRRRPLPRV